MNDGILAQRAPGPYQAIWVPQDTTACLKADGPLAYERLSPRIAEQAMRFIWLADGLGLFIYQGTWHRPGCLIAWRELAETALELRFSLSGETRLRFADKTLTQTPQRALIQVARPGDHYEASNKVGEFNSRITLLVTRTCLRKLCADEDLPSAIAGIADTSPRAETVVLVPTPEMRGLASALVETPPPERVQRLHLMAVAHQLLAQAFLILLRRDGNREGLEVTESDRRRTQQARDILMASLNDPPLVRDLARCVGMSQRQLNHCFREIYGNTVLQCLTQWRLERAQTLLRQGGLCVKQIAYELGYRHPENFILAFTKHVGMSPKDFRAWQPVPV